MSVNKLIDGFEYPAEFIRIVEQNLVDLNPWCIFFGEKLMDKYTGLKSRYPSRALIPFAERWDNDDVACFDANNPEIIHIVHDFASPGWEKRERFKSFGEWFRRAIEDMIEFDT